MNPQDLREELLQREAYALGYKNGSTDVIMSLAKKEEIAKQEAEKTAQTKNLESKKEKNEVQNANHNS